MRRVRDRLTRYFLLREVRMNTNESHILLVKELYLFPLYFRSKYFGVCNKANIKLPGTNPVKIGYQESFYRLEVRNYYGELRVACIRAYMKMDRTKMVYEAKVMDCRLFEGSFDCLDSAKDFCEEFLIGHGGTPQNDLQAAIESFCQESFCSDGAAIAL